MPDKNMCYMVMKTLGFDWLKIHRDVILIMSVKNDINSKSLRKVLKCLIGLKISALTVPIHIRNL